MARCALQLGYPFNFPFSVLLVVITFFHAYVLMADLCAVSSWRCDPVSKRLYPGPGLQCGQFYCWIVWQGTKGGGSLRVGWPLKSQGVLGPEWTANERPSESPCTLNMATTTTWPWLWSTKLIDLSIPHWPPLTIWTTLCTLSLRPVYSSCFLALKCWPEHTSANGFTCQKSSLPFSYYYIYSNLSLCYL